MKKNHLIALCLGLVLAAPVMANNNGGSGTIVFTGSVVEGNCLMNSHKNEFQTSCWNGSEMEEARYKIETNKPFDSKLSNNRGTMNVNWINDTAALMNIVYY